MRGVMRMALISLIGSLAMVAVVVSLLIVANGRGDPVASLGPADDGRDLSLVEGDVFEVALPGNPATGYTWVVMSDESVVRQIGDIDVRGGDEQLGSGGTMVLAFECVGPGSTELVLEYLRPFEPNEPPVAMFSVLIAVSS